MLNHRLNVYRSRLENETSAERIAFYQAEIDDMEAELLLQELLYELKLWPPLICETDKIDKLRDLLEFEDVLNTSFVWSWKSLTWVWRIEFYYSQ